MKAEVIGILRLSSGLCLMGFVVCHLVNHIFGLYSIAAMDAAHRYLMGPWRSSPLDFLLWLAVVTHLLLAFRSLLMRRTYHLARWEWFQILTGLAIPFLLIEHIAGTVAAERLLDAKPGYALVLVIFWHLAPFKGILQALAMILVWVHGCIGLHYWLRTKGWYAAYCLYFLALALIIPTMSLAGYLSAGFEILERVQDDNFIPARLQEANISLLTVEKIGIWTRTGWILFASALLAPVVRHFILKAIRHFQTYPQISYSDGRRIPVLKGASILEILRANNIALASVCGGRGRCTTCRVQITEGLDHLPPPENTEVRALERIQAPRGLRLACQVRPHSDIAITPLLPADATAWDGRRPGGLEGHEKSISIMFIDLRGSTRLGEEKLPYDVLFILNRFFAEMTAALRETKGHYAQFNGDGLMALYGLQDSDPQTGARQILTGAQAMLRRLDILNKSLHSELKEPLKIGIGIHYGEAIVGIMGPPHSQLTTAIGDNVNIAARLESLTKEYNVPLIISQTAARMAGFEIDENRLHEIVIRGRDAAIKFYAVDDFSDFDQAPPRGFVLNPAKTGSE